MDGNNSGNAGKCPVMHGGAKQTHAGVHARVDAGHDFVAHRVMLGVAPPEEHVGLGEALLGQAVLRFVEGGGGDLQGGIFSQRGGKRGMNAVGINFRHDGIRPLMHELAPDGHADLAHAPTIRSAPPGRRARNFGLELTSSVQPSARPCAKPGGLELELPRVARHERTRGLHAHHAHNPGWV